MRRLRPLAPYLLAFLGYLALAVAMTWPLATRLGDAVLDAPFWYDALSNTSHLTARVHGVLGDTALGPWDGWYFWPVTPSIVFNESLYGLALLYAPLYLLGGDPLVAYNLLLLVALALSGATMFALGRHLTGSSAAALVAGAVFAFCPYVAFQLGRVQLVALGWLPLTLLFLLRASATGRTRDLAGLAASWLLQLATCLYYALFLLPVLAFAAAWLALTRRRPLAGGPPAPRLAWLQALAVLAATGLAAFALVAPYLLHRYDLGLRWTGDTFSRLAGSLAALAHVPRFNRALSPLHHAPDLSRGVEDIAFPGLTATALAALAVAAPLGRALADGRARAVRHLLAVLAATLLAALGATVAFRTMAAALPVVAAAAVYWRRRGLPGLLPAPLPLLLACLALTLALFLGAAPFTVDGEPVRGLYALLVDHVPGFRGMRKVSRQAALLVLFVAPLAALGVRVLLPAGARPRRAAAVAAALLAFAAWELRVAPWDLRPAPSAATLPAAYRWLRDHRDAGPVAAVPARRGTRALRGEVGSARHNYLAAFHLHRTVNGKSTFIPDVTRRLRRELDALPDSDALDLLGALGVRHLVVHLHELPAARRAALTAWLAARPDALRPVLAEAGVALYALHLPDPPPLLPTPAPPPGPLEEVAPVAARASRRPAEAARAVDGDPATRWSTGGPAHAGDWIAFELPAPRLVAALETPALAHAFDAPRGWALDVSDDGATWRTALEQPGPVYFEEQVQRPGRFVFRVVLPAPTRARHLRLRLLTGTSVAWWSVFEARVLAVPP